MARARRRRAVCQVGDLFGLNTGRGPAAARVGVRHSCGSASRSAFRGGGLLWGTTFDENRKTR
jgi:hypothetical protein